jgi:predicted nucleic acid-binding Zn ribbon protein
MMQGFSHLGELVKAGLERVGLHGAVRENSALALWAEVVGEKTASATQADRVRNGIMYVTCRDSLWAQELHFLRPIIIEKLNERLGGEVIREIRLSGVGFRKTGRREEEESALPKQEEGPALTDRDLAEIKGATAAITEPELAERVVRALRAGRALRKRRE